MYAFLLTLLPFLTWFVTSCDAIYLSNGDTYFSKYSDETTGWTTYRMCFGFQKGKTFSYLPRTIVSGVLAASHSIETGGLFPRTGCQTVQLQLSRAELTNDRSSTSTYLYALVVCLRTDFSRFYPRFPFFPSSFVSFFVFLSLFIFPPLFIHFFWTTQSASL